MWYHNQGGRHSAAGAREGGVPSLDFYTYRYVFFSKLSFCVNIPNLTNYRSSLLRWLTLGGRSDYKTKWGPGYNFFR